MPDRIAALILAAGASTRLGRPKQLIRLDGETLLRRTTRLAAEAACAPVFVVLGYQADEMRGEVDGLSATVLTNEDWATGMSSSLRRGMMAVSGCEAEPAGVLLLVCDQPALSGEHLRRLLDRHAAADSPVTASFYGGRRGVPAIFRARLFPELLQVVGDRGARDVIGGLNEQIQSVAWPEGQLDIDTTEDMKQLKLQ